jgi:hypothetical protein
MHGTAARLTRFRHVDNAGHMDGKRRRPRPGVRALRRRSPSPAVERPRISWRTRHHGRTGFSGVRRGRINRGRPGRPHAEPPHGRAAARQPRRRPLPAPVAVAAGPPPLNRNGAITPRQRRRRRARVALTSPLNARASSSAPARRRQSPPPRRAWRQQASFRKACAARCSHCPGVLTCLARDHGLVA